jgi:DNA-binding NtrC family response regulator
MSAQGRGVVLAVDDERGFRENAAEYLEGHGYEVLHAGEAESALERARSRLVDVALVDVLMPGMDGIALLGKLKEISSLTEVIVITGQGSVEAAVEAMRLGAYHYATKPVKLKELELLVRRAMEKGRLARQNRSFREALQRKRTQGTVEWVVGSDRMRKLLSDIEEIAKTDSTVLIEGETGTGKELIAEHIHGKSARSEESFSVLNCGAIADTLLDSELFGHEKGAFTGANEARPGMLETADRGTLLLDEIGEMSSAAQVRLLRVLERRVFRRVGSTRERAVDVRILAATNRDLTKEVSEGRFREDLYHRLLVFRLRIPPLRERPEDILPLAEHFLKRLAGPGSSSKTLASSAAEALRRYRWPGNVRELAHAMERASFAAGLAGSDNVKTEHLGLISPSSSSVDVLVSLDEAERRHLMAVLDRVGGNRQKAAQVLGISERHLYRLLKKRVSSCSAGLDEHPRGGAEPQVDGPALGRPGP